MPVLALSLYVVFAVVAFGLRTALAMGASWRIGVDPGERTTLVTGGPFALVRNPIFSAPVEEAHLLRAHGELYAAYAARVGRFIPTLGKLGDAR